MTYKSVRAVRRQRPDNAFENGRVQAPVRALCSITADVESPQKTGYRKCNPAFIRMLIARR